MRSLVLILSLFRDESALRQEAEQALGAKEASVRIEGLEKLKGAKEGKSIQVLVKGLVDADKAVRKSAAYLLEGAADAAGLALEPLAGLARKPEEEAEVRLACVKALLKSPYQEVPFRAVIDTMASIRREDRHLHKFGAEVTALLDKRTGKSYGADKATVDLWDGWYSDNLARMKSEDAKLREAAGSGK